MPTKALHFVAHVFWIDECSLQETIPSDIDVSTPKRVLHKAKLVSQSDRFKKIKIKQTTFT